MASEELLNHQKEIAVKRRLFAQARAIIQRGRNAEIPDRYLRIKKDEFESLLCKKFHGNTKLFADKIYRTPKILFNQSFVIIDGGDIYSRKKAGFAILFRMIACDRHGLYQDCGELYGKFQTIRNSAENRNELVERLQKENVLFINEFRQNEFSVHFESGNFFDQLLGHRDDYSKPTILTFTNPLSNGIVSQENAIKDDRCGLYLARLSHADIKKDENVFRIRLK